MLVSSSFTVVPNSQEARDEYTAVSEGTHVKKYAVYKEREDGSLLVPKDKTKIDDPDAFITQETLITLRDYQVDPVTECVDYLRSRVSGVLLNAACGTGKTVCALAIADILQAKSVIILIDQKDIAQQWADRIKQFLFDTGVSVYHSKARPIQELKEDTNKFKVVVAQSLVTKDWSEEPVECDLLICDEAHVFSAPIFCRSIFNISYRRSLALTATEDRKDGLSWIFMRFLAGHTVKVSASTMQAKVIRPEIKCGLNWKHYGTAWCATTRKQTHYANCQGCEYFHSFPHDCGGKLRRYNSKVAWNYEQIAWTPMLLDLVNSQYTDTFVSVIVKFFEKGRQVLIFNQFVAPLKHLQAEVSKQVGEINCGLYVSGTKDVSESLQRPLTFTTYKMSQKALDVPWKDSVIMTSPISDIRQTVGRSTRIVLGKKQPVIFDPIITDVIMFTAQARKRHKQYIDLGFEL